MRIQEIQQVYDDVTNGNGLPHVVVFDSMEQFETTIKTLEDRGLKVDRSKLDIKVQECVLVSKKEQNSGKDHKNRKCNPSGRVGRG